MRNGFSGKKRKHLSVDRIKSALLSDNVHNITFLFLRGVYFYRYEHTIFAPEFSGTISTSGGDFTAARCRYSNYFPSGLRAHGQSDRLRMPKPRNSITSSVLIARSKVHNRIGATFFAENELVVSGTICERVIPGKFYKNVIAQT